MTQLVTVQTDFADLEQMAEGLVGRVHATHVILPAGMLVDESEWAQFEIALHDGSLGLTGLGRCVTVVDNGNEREPHQRYDVVLDSLQFDTHEQSVFEHILALHGTGGQALEEVSAEDAESMPPAQYASSADADHDSERDAEYDTGGFEVNAEYQSTPPMSVPADAFDDEGGDEGDIPDERTMVASPDELEQLSDSIPSPGGEANDVTPHQPSHVSVPQAVSSRGGNGAGYAHGGVAHAVAHAVSPGLVEDAFEEPLSGERIAPITQARPVNGNAFIYTNGIPFPAKPPRPELEASLRVTPAPRPAGTGH